MPEKTDLSKMNLEELKELRKDIDKAITGAERAARKKALEDVQKAAQKHGFALSDLVSGKSKLSSPKPKAPPRYRNPKDTSETWSGRGRQPEWLKEAIKSGTPKEKMEI